MRQPLENRDIMISRTKFTATYACSFMLVASMNLSPSGYFNDPNSPMISSPQEMQRYLSKISVLRFRFVVFFLLGANNY
jgi:magnesium chelatase family protein